VIEPSSSDDESEDPGELGDLTTVVKDNLPAIAAGAALISLGVYWALCRRAS
jgi:hypothetical protein